MSAEKTPIPVGSNFIRAIIEQDLVNNKYATKKWAGSPGDAAHHAAGQIDNAKIRTRFPPEPNGYLHIGHSKSIFLNFGLARDFGGICHLRFDDTNPEKESQEYVDSIKDSVNWLGFGWENLVLENQASQNNSENNLYYASDYFEFMYRASTPWPTGCRNWVPPRSPSTRWRSARIPSTRCCSPFGPTDAVSPTTPYRLTWRNGQPRAYRVPPISARSSAALRRSSWPACGAARLTASPRPRACRSWANRSKSARAPN